VTTTDAIRTCVENAERQVWMFSQRVQRTPLLLVISIFACENTHSVALGLSAELLRIWIYNLPEVVFVALSPVTFYIAIITPLVW